MNEESLTQDLNGHRCSPVHLKAIRLTDGILADRCRANYQNLFRRIDGLKYFSEVFGEEHDEWYAEPEFCGHFLDSAMDFYASTGDEEILGMVESLVSTILRHQRDDGYLGTYRRGMEFSRSFSVWNQQFVIMGLLSYYEVTGSRDALEGAEKCAHYIANHFLENGGKDLLECINGGIQHSCILVEIVRLLRLTGKPVYRDFIDLILKRWQESNLRLLTVADRKVLPVFEIGCQKGIEILICYRGLAELYRLTGEPLYLQACEAYWDFLNGHQIGITGNGSIGEVWNPAGKNTRHVSTDFLPNENCVAMGWMMFSATLFAITGRSCYMDAYERTLYNHLLGAQALDGSDFSYYQGTYGRKVHAKTPGQYSCCRYRGMRILGKLPSHCLARHGKGLTLSLFSSLQAKAEVDGTDIELDVRTDFPRKGRVSVDVTAPGGKAFELRFRQPEWCPEVTLRINGADADCARENGYMVIDREWSSEPTSVVLDFPLELRSEVHEVDHVPCVAVQRGPVVMAIDSRHQPIEGLRIKLPLDHQGDTPDAQESIVGCSVGGVLDGQAGTVRLVDYASAGSIDPERDRFRVWVPCDRQES